MVKRKKILHPFMIIAAVMVIFTVGPGIASAQVTFNDVNESNTHYDNIMKLADGGVFYGDNGNFYPYKSISRGQVAAVLTRAFPGMDPPNDLYSALLIYDDVSIHSDYAEEIAAVTYFRIFQGSNGKFNTWKPITREQMATVIVKAFKFDEMETDNVPLTDKRISKVHRKNVQIIANLGITDQTDNFRAHKNIQRDQFASFMVRAFDAAQQ